MTPREVYVRPEDYTPEQWVVDPEKKDWEVWNPSWEPRYGSANGWECVRAMDALEAVRNSESSKEAEARVEDIARQFAYLNDAEDMFRERFPDANEHINDVYENVELKEKKGE